MVLAVKFLFLLNCLLSSKTHNESDDDVLELINSAGYKGESHLVETQDGYILKVHRIVPKKPNTLKKPVFLMHGLLAASADFVITGPQTALAYYLSDAGYDVWMGNARGNKHSSKHKKFHPDSKNYWSFSWHEIGFYDLPAMLDYVLKFKNSTKLFYVGHSQGTTSLLVLLSSHPEYNEKIIQGHLMAVSAYRNSLPGSLDQILEFQSLFSSNASGFYDFTPLFHLGQKFSEIMCNGEDPKKLAFCEMLIFRVVGSNKGEIEIDAKVLPKLLQHFSPRISSMQMDHYVQLTKSGKFEQFDYGEKNCQHYGSSKQPEYNLKNVVADIYLYHAAEDLLVPRSSVEKVKLLLPNVRRYRVIKNWNHIDFTYGKHSRTVLYKDFLKSFEEFK